MLIYLVSGQARDLVSWPAGDLAGELVLQKILEES